MGTKEYADKLSKFCKSRSIMIIILLALLSFAFAKGYWFCLRKDIIELIRNQQEYSFIVASKAIEESINSLKDEPLIALAHEKLNKSTDA